VRNERDTSASILECVVAHIPKVGPGRAKTGRHQRIFVIFRAFRGETSNGQDRPSNGKFVPAGKGVECPDGLIRRPLIVELARRSTVSRSNSSKSRLPHQRLDDRESKRFDSLGFEALDRPASQ
jgi:hypothetical protein